jgi:hypothetical protein
MKKRLQTDRTSSSLCLESAVRWVIPGSTPAPAEKNRQGPMLLCCRASVAQASSLYFIRAEQCHWEQLELLEIFPLY